MSKIMVSLTTSGRADEPHWSGDMVVSCESGKLKANIDPIESIFQMLTPCCGAPMINLPAIKKDAHFCHDCGTEQPYPGNLPAYSPGYGDIQFSLTKMLELWFDYLSSNALQAALDASAVSELLSSYESLTNEPGSWRFDRPSLDLSAEKLKQAPAPSGCEVVLEVLA